MQLSTPIKSAMILYSVVLLINCSTPKKEESNQYTIVEKTVNTAFNPSEGRIEILDSSCENLIDKDAKIEILSEGYTWTEGPVWVEDGGYLLFSDIPANAIWKWDPKNGISLYLKPSGFTGSKERSGETGSNGLFVNNAGQLLLCQHGDRRIAVMNAYLASPKADCSSISDNYEGKKLNSPNDLEVHSNGDIYFTDPPYGLEKNMEDPLKELDFQGIFKWSSTDNSTQLVFKDLSRPNGIALSPDEKTAYAANSDPSRAIYMAFDVNDDCSFSNERVFFDATQMAKEEYPDLGMPDGMDVDKNGNIFATGPGGILIFSADEKLIGQIITGKKTANCTIGSDGYLYMTSHSFLTRIKLKY